VFWAARFFVLSNRITLLLPGREICPRQRQTTLHLVIYIYLLRCTTAVVNYMLHPTEEPTHNTQANLWAQVTVHLCVQLMSASISRLFKQKTPKRCVETMESSCTILGSVWEEPRDMRPLKVSSLQHLNHQCSCNTAASKTPEHSHVLTAPLSLWVNSTTSDVWSSFC
jgi:hypothetical protein